MNSRRGIRLKKGDDNGCFAAAISTVRRVGGVLEHPRGSHAWAAFGIPRPPDAGGWIQGVGDDGWTCCVYQGSYGHRALKPTWLYFKSLKDAVPPSLKWGRPVGEFVTVAGTSFKSKAHKQAAILSGWVYKKRLPTKERAKTPLPFRDLLLKLADLCGGNCPEPYPKLLQTKIC